MSQTLGKYELQAELGRGAFATVYRALDMTLDRPVALKVLHPQLLTDPTFIQRFQQEAKLMATLQHAHIGTVFEVAQSEGQVYIAMQLADGGTLAKTIAERGAFSLDETLEILAPLCQALDYAHAQNIVHRDLKPANVLLDKKQGPLLSDFGFARLVSLNSVSSVNMSGGIIGTPAYIAPEVWDYDVAEAPADIYALGCIVYEMLTGDVLFTGPTPMQIMRAHDRGPQLSAKTLAEFPPGLETVLRKALAREPAARYVSATALWQALEDLKPSPVLPPKSDPVALSPQQRALVWPWAGGAAGFIILVIVGFLAVGGRDAQPETVTVETVTVEKVTTDEAEPEAATAIVTIGTEEVEEVPTDTPRPLTSTSEPTKSPADYVVTEAYLILNPTYNSCPSNHQIFVTVLDLNGNPIDGVAVEDTNRAVPPHISGDKGPGKLEFDIWNNGFSLEVTKNNDGSLATSEVTPKLSSQDEDIPDEWLVEANYCKDLADCTARKANNQLCRGHYAYNVTFQRTY